LTASGHPSEKNTFSELTGLFLLNNLQMMLSSLFSPPKNAKPLLAGVLSMSLAQTMERSITLCHHSKRLSFFLVQRRTRAFVHAHSP